MKPAFTPPRPTEHLIADARAKALRLDQLAEDTFSTTEAVFHAAVARLLRDMAHKLEAMK